MNRPAIAALTASAAAATACGAPPQAEIGSPDFTALKQAEPLLQDSPDSSTTTSSSTTVTIRSKVVPQSASTFTLPEDEGPQSDAQWWMELEGFDGVWPALADCESGTTNANTGNGYYGFWQFSLATWRSVGETGYPHEHSYEHQLAAAKRLQARSGWGQWPACARKLGLR